MKKILLVCVAVLAMFACQKEESGIAQKDIVGKWNVTHLWNKTSNKWIEVPEGYAYAQFNADNTYKSDGANGTYTIDENDIVCKVGNVTVKYRFELNGNNATATVTEGSRTPYKVKATRV